jgi:hypothetical protein
MRAFVKPYEISNCFVVIFKRQLHVLLVCDSKSDYLSASREQNSHGKFSGSCRYSRSSQTYSYRVFLHRFSIDVIETGCWLAYHFQSRTCAGIIGLCETSSYYDFISGSWTFQSLPAAVTISSFTGCKAVHRIAKASLTLSSSSCREIDFLPSTV